MSSIVIIPARGGSKRIPKKNIKEFMGKPMLAYSVEAAVESGIYDEVMVSTDSEEIAEIALKYGASVPFMRSEKTASDYATTTDVLLEVLDNYKKEGKEFDILSCLYPTAPFVTGKKLREAYEAFLSSDGDSLVSVVPFSYPPQRGFVYDENGYLSYREPQYMNTRSQDLPKMYHDAGQFYFTKTASFYKNLSFAVGRSVPYVLSETEVQDIDNDDDWTMAEIKLKMMAEKK